ncbi:hypothetical protein HPB48_014758 [Haemaphysalis longicornis]|uniref:Transposase Helix-turn-helix domain-containing protein n=1 Tax=Haemaphysalis longicornis TaxID=44386 RepID=A0A9J6FLU7_HAELO|nr:hypothetical protein HPB48_014758 [Haemaphysalis longicornis]
MNPDELSEEEEIATILLVSAALSTKAAVTLPKKRRFWVRPYLRSREAAGHASRLLPELRAHDLEYFRDFIRMPPQAFDQLLGLVRSRISKQDTNFRDAISAHDRLAITLRFLAAGSTLRSISFDFRVGRSTACDVVADVCAALWDILKPLYLVSPQTADEWIKARNWFNSLCFRVHTFF